MQRWHVHYYEVLPFNGNVLICGVYPRDVGPDACGAWRMIACANPLRTRATTLRKRPAQAVRTRL